MGRFSSVVFAVTTLMIAIGIGKCFILYVAW